MFPNETKNLSLRLLHSLLWITSGNFSSISSAVFEKVRWIQEFLDPVKSILLIFSKTAEQIQLKFHVVIQGTEWSSLCFIWRLLKHQELSSSIKSSAAGSQLFGNQMISKNSFTTICPGPEHVLKISSRSVK